MKVAVRALIGGAFVVALAVIAGPVAAQATAAPTKIGYVDVQTVLRGMPGYAQAESLYVRERDAAQSELERLGQAFDSAVAVFEQQSALLSASNRAAKQKELGAEQQRVEQRAEQLRNRVALRERELIQPMQERLSSVIEGIRAEGNYAVIFDIGALGPAVVAADKTLDLTQRVVQRLQQSN